MPRRWKVIEYEDAKGGKPVQRFVKELTPTEQGTFLKRLEYLQLDGLNASSGIIKNIKGSKRNDPRNKLWELRIPHSQHNPRILLFADSGRKLVLLHGFKKIGKPSDKIPSSEISIAVKRMQDYQERHGG